MILFYNASGNLIKITPEHVYQGSDGATTLYFVAPITPTAAVSVAFNLPNGERTAKHILTPFEGELNGVTDENGNVFKIWTVNIDGHITAYSGIATAQFFITINGIIRATEAANFTVEEGVPPVLQPIEGNVYDEIISYIQTVWGQINADLATKQDIIDENNKLPSDYVTDEGQNHKFVSEADKTKWDNKQDKLTAGRNIRIIDNVISAEDELTPVDDHLSTTSENPVQNKVITQALNSAISGVYKFQGTRTVTQLNNLTKTSAMNGYVYNVSTSGQLRFYIYSIDNTAYIDVIEGDNVALVWRSELEGGWYWDKLAGTIDLSNYYTKPETDTKLSKKINTSDINQTFFDSLY